MKKEILTLLEPLFEKAEKENLWFYAAYQHLWFSPKELKQRHKSGQFIWGPSNWDLRDPVEHLKELEKKQASALMEFTEFNNRLLEYFKE